MSGRGGLPRRGVVSGLAALAPPKGGTGFAPGAVEKVLLAALEETYGLGVTAFRALSLFHIRGVSDFQYMGQTHRTVIFEPEFLYVADIGRGRLAGFEIGYAVPELPAGLCPLGDPAFPDLGEIRFASVRALEEAALLYPATPGRMLVGMETDLPEAEALKRLSAVLAEPEAVIPGAGLYGGFAGWFDEDATAARIEREVEGVRYVSLDTRVRLADFAPGWRVDQVL